MAVWKALAALGVPLVVSGLQIAGKDYTLQGRAGDAREAAEAQQAHGKGQQPHNRFTGDKISASIGLAFAKYTSCLWPYRSATQQECESAAESAANANGKTAGRTMQTGGGGYCNHQGWGQVPMGCSVQSGFGGDWAAHYKTSPNQDGSTYKSGCMSSLYRLVCIRR